MGKSDRDSGDGDYDCGVFLTGAVGEGEGVTAIFQALRRFWEGRINKSRFNMNPTQRRFMEEGLMSEPRPRITHELKTWPEFFEQTRNGRKKFELRRNDRDFKVGDELLLMEWDPEDKSIASDRVWGAQGYTGRELLVRVDYIMTGGWVDTIMGLEDHEGPEHVIMSISHVN